MKVCLISAPTANQFDGRSVGEHEAARIMGELAPVGILSLAAVLEARGLHPEVVDINRVYYRWLQGPNPNKIDFCRFAAAYLAGPDFDGTDFFGFSTVCSSYPLTLRIAAEIKRSVNIRWSRWVARKRLWLTFHHARLFRRLTW